MIRVLHLISSEGFYGAENMLLLLGRYQEMEGCAVCIGAFRDARNPHTEVADLARTAGLETVIIPSSGRCSLGAIRQIRRLLERGNIDVLHTHGYKSNLIGRLAAAPRGTPLVSTVHGRNRDSLRMRLYSSLDNFVLRGFDRVAAVSEVLADMLISAGVSSKRVLTIPNGVEADGSTTPRPTSLLHPRRPAVGMVARLVREKGGDVFLRSAEIVLRRLPEITFYLVGDGPCRPEWTSLANQLGIANRVVFTGVRSDMATVYASLDALVLPSYNEGLPMCVLEAMAAGMPVIATAVGSVPRVVIPRRTGLLVPVADADALATAIIEVFEDRERARVWGDNARALITSEYSAPVMARRYLAAYEEAILPRAPERVEATSAEADQP